MYSMGGFVLPGAPTLPVPLGSALPYWTIKLWATYIFICFPYFSQSTTITCMIGLHDTILKWKKWYHWKVTLGCRLWSCSFLLVHHVQLNFSVYAMVKLRQDDLYQDHWHQKQKISQQICWDILIFIVIIGPKF